MAVSFVLLRSHREIVLSNQVAKQSGTFSMQPRGVCSVNHGVGLCRIDLPCRYLLSAAKCPMRRCLPPAG